MRRLGRGGEKKHNIADNNISPRRYARRRVEDTIKQWINKPPTAMYDIGVGIYSEWLTLKSLYRNMNVYGCEPHPDEYKELLPIFNGQLKNVAISSENGEADIYLTPLGKGGSRMSVERQTDRPIKIETWTLDKFDEWANKEERILLWMDIEGHELIALKSGIKLLESRRVKWLNLETRNNMDEDWKEYPLTKDINKFLANYGYRNVYRYNVQGTYREAPGDCIYVLEGE